MPIGIKQSRFDGGEISPQWYGRTDSPKFATAARTLKNLTPLPYGPVISRPGTSFIGSTKDQNVGNIPYLFSFVFSDQTAYLLEFGNLYLRIWERGTTSYGSGQPSATLVTPWASNALPYLKLAQVGNVVEIFYGGQATNGVPVQPRELRYTPTTGTWSLNYTPLSPNIDPVTQAQIVVGVTPQFSWLALPYVGTNIYTYGQMAYAAAGGDGSLWVCIQVSVTGLAATFGPPASAATSSIYWNLAIDVAHQPKLTTFAVTATYINTLTGVSGESSVFATLAYTGPLSLDRLVQTVLLVGAPNVPLLAGYNFLYFSFYQGNNGIYGYIGDTPYPIGDVPSLPSNISFTFDGTAPDFTRQPPPAPTAFGDFNVNGGADYPSVVGHFEQRRVCGNTGQYPNRYKGSKTGDFSRYDRPIPGDPASDAYSFDLADEFLADIRWFVGLRTLLVGTGKSEWSVRGDNGTAIEQTSVDQKRQSQWGSSWLQPITIGNGIIFNTAKSNMVRDLFPMYGLYTDNWEGDDLTAYARHLLQYNKIVSWAFQSTPYQILWLVRDDGVLLSLTYDRKKEICAWARHTTGNGDIFESVAVVPEPPMDAVYVVVRRFLNGAWVRGIERFNNIVQPQDVRYAQGLDCSSQYDGHITDGTKIQLSGSVYNAGSPVSLAITPGPNWTSFTAGTAIVMDPDGTAGGPITIILQSAGADLALGELQQPLSAAQQALWVSAATTNFAVAVNNLTTSNFTGIAADSGLVQWPQWSSTVDYTIGTTVCYGDETPPWTCLQACGPNEVNGPIQPGSSNAYWGPASVSTRGVVCLVDGATVIPTVISAFGGTIVGLPNNLFGVVIQTGIAYDADFEPLDLNTQAAELRNKFKRVVRVGFELASSRGVWVGQDFSDLLNEFIQNQVSDGTTLPQLTTDYQEVFIASDFNKNGRIVIRHFDPVPFTLLAVLREVELGGT